MGKTDRFINIPTPYEEEETKSIHSSSSKPGQMIKNGWGLVLEKEFAAPYFKKLWGSIVERRRVATVYPKESEVFAAFNWAPFSEVKVVIVGQDPYHGEGQAEGLSFSVGDGVRLPPSLKNIFKELEQDVGVESPKRGSLKGWAKQGVLLLNAVLTVEEGVPASHKGLGWELFTDAVIEALNEREAPVVFILWGKHAEAKGRTIDRNKHLVLSSPHPSPLSAYQGFFGSRPFSKTNEFLKSNKIKEVNWHDI